MLTVYGDELHPIVHRSFSQITEAGANTAWNFCSTSLLNPALARHRGVDGGVLYENCCVWTDESESIPGPQIERRGNVWTGPWAI
jgi:hypothetical protein